MIKHVAFFVFPVTDMKRAREFYEEVLGLQFARSFMDGDTWVEYDVDGVTLAISDQLPGPPCTGGGIAFEVDDLEAQRERLVAKGIKFLYEPDSPVCNGLVFADPDGNMVGFHQFKE